MEGVRVTAGDYNRAEVADRMDRPGITGDAVAHYQQYAEGQPCVVFCTGLKHAERVAKRSTPAGWKFAVLDGTLSPQAARVRVIALTDGTPARPRHRGHRLRRLRPSCHQLARYC